MYQSRVVRTILTLCVLLPLSGCNYPQLGRPLERTGGVLGLTDPGQAFDPPLMRMGVMPFPVWYSPYNPVSVDDLGTHRYIAAGGLPMWVGEESRGTIYTTRGGFLDLAHIRNSIDLTRYTYEHVADAFRDGRTELEMLSSEPDLYRVRLDPPKRWKNERQRRLAAVHVAGRLGYLMTTWHEVVTWFGYTGIVVSEQPSAFSYDDAPSHMVGVIAAMRALEKQPDLDRFDEAVTRELAEYLRDLGAVSAEEVAKAMEESKADGWADLVPERRLIHLGMTGETMHPILLPSMPGDDEPVRWRWEPNEKVMGLKVEKLYDVWIEPATFQGGDIREAAGIKGLDRPIHPRQDFGTLRLTLLAQEMP